MHFADRAAAGRVDSVRTDTAAPLVDVLVARHLLGLPEDPALDPALLAGAPRPGPVPPDLLARVERAADRLWAAHLSWRSARTLELEPALTEAWQALYDALRAAVPDGYPRDFSRAKERVGRTTTDATRHRPHVPVEELVIRVERLMGAPVTQEPHVDVLPLAGPYRLVLPGDCLVVDLASWLAA